MSVIAIVVALSQAFGGYAARVTYVDPANNIFYPDQAIFSGSTLTSYAQILAAAQTSIISTAAANYGITITGSDIDWGYVAAVPLSYTFNASRSFTTGTGATGFQVSATRNSAVDYNITIVSTSTISGAQLGTVVLEAAPTNSATAGDWKEVARCTNGQAVSLAVVLQSVQTTGCALPASVPAGYYLKLRTIQTTGAPTFTYNSGMETLQ